jgi:hypothetical protein
MVCSDMLCRRFAAGSDQTTAPLGKPNGKVLLSLRDERFNGLCHEVAAAPCRGPPAHGKALGDRAFGDRAFGDRDFGGQ